jgi:hypothetical protein
MRKQMRLLVGMAAMLLVAGPALAEDAPDPPHLTIKDHHFQPARLEVPAGVKFKLIVKNEDSTPEEFESFDLNREKIMPPGQETPVFLGPLAPGEYKIFGDFHQDTARGVIVAK